MPQGYPVPAATAEIEIVIKKSRFVTRAQRAITVAQARERLAAIRAEKSGANHHVYAFRVGFGQSIIEGMSDAGEPTGTAGPPTLAVLRGSGIGDILLATARYFGGVKLGTGGLARAYRLAAQEALQALPTELKVEKRAIGLELPYSAYNLVKRLIKGHEGKIIDETFEAQILVIAEFAAPNLPGFSLELRERTAGALTPIDLS